MRQGPNTKKTKNRYNNPMGRIDEKERIKKISRRLAKTYPDAKIALRYKTNWELLIAVILSAQCTDKKVNEVTARLFKKYKTLEDYVRAKPKEFERDIHATGFFRAK